MINSKSDIDRVAYEIYYDFYVILYCNVSDFDEDVTISKLAIKLAIKSVELILSEVSKDIVRIDRNGMNQYDFYNKVLIQLRNYGNNNTKTTS